MPAIGAEIDAVGGVVSVVEVPLETVTLTVDEAPLLPAAS
jgi:hypothetical protein